MRVVNREPILQELSIPITLSKHYKEIDLDVIRIATYNIILGLP